MKASHDEERKRWAEREETITKIETVHKELETNYKQTKASETECRYKIKELTIEIIKKEEQVKHIESEFGNKLQYYESNDYIIKRIEKSIQDTRGTKGGSSNPIYESFMKLNFTGDKTNNDNHGSRNHLSHGGSAGDAKQLSRNALNVNDNIKDINRSYSSSSVNKPDSQSNDRENKKKKTKGNQTKESNKEYGYTGETDESQDFESTPGKLNKDTSMKSMNVYNSKYLTSRKFDKEGDPNHKRRELSYDDPEYKNLSNIKN